MNKFFVYGTLKKGGYYSAYFDEIRTSSKAAKLKDHDLFAIGSKENAPFPGIVSGKGVVIGELHEYDEDFELAVLHNLDHIEGFNEKKPENSLYLRTVKEVELEDGSIEKAYVYTFNREIFRHYQKRESGIWEL